MVFVLSATNTGSDLAAYFLPANATIYPPDTAWCDGHDITLVIGTLFMSKLKKKLKEIILYWSNNIEELL